MIEPAIPGIAAVRAVLAAVEGTGLATGMFRKGQVNGAARLAGEDPLAVVLPDRVARVALPAWAAVVVVAEAADEAVAAAEAVADVEGSRDTQSEKANENKIEQLTRTKSSFVRLNDSFCLCSRVGNVCGDESKRGRNCTGQTKGVCLLKRSCRGADPGGRQV